MIAKASFAQVFTHADLVNKLGYAQDISNNKLLSHEEIDSLNNYVSSDIPLFEDINSYLRGTTTNFWYFSSTEEVDAQISLIDESFKKLPTLPKETILFRGQTLGYRKDKHFTNGEIITDKSYWSTTTNFNKAKTYAGGNGAVFIIYSTKKDFTGIALNKKESEVLLPRNIVLKVMINKVIKGKQFAVVQVCEDKNSCESSVTNNYAINVWNQLVL